jgi:hypothetical protein
MTVEQKIIGGISLLTLSILVGAVFLLSGNSNVKSSISKDQIVAENGIHWHPKLLISIQGKKQEIPANIGIGAVHQKIHTHPEDNKEGVVHMEMQGIVTKEDTKLGNFFKIWGKEFNSTQIFDKENGKEGKVVMLVNGKKNMEFENYHMRDGDIIEIRYE